MKHILKKLILILMICSFPFIVFAEEDSENSFETRIFQLSVITPVGTNGLYSHLIINNISLNLLGGYSKGNIGFEAGALYNVNLEITEGLQVAGLANYSGNGDNAVQFAGLANVNRELGGAQFAGISNLTLNGETSFQASGIFNYSKLSKVQFAGVSNLTLSGNNAFQLAGILNYAENSNVQISGFMNIAKNISGLQLGLINISETNDGVPIGLFNIVKNGGKHELEISASDVLHTELSFKLGIDRFYTIFSGGVNYFATPFEFALGLGVGTNLDLADNVSAQFELRTYSFTDDTSFINNSVSVLNQLRVTLEKEFASHFKMFFGPVLNVSVSDYKGSDNSDPGFRFVPYSLWYKETGGMGIDIWIGGVAGVRF